MVPHTKGLLGGIGRVRRGELGRAKGRGGRVRGEMGLLSFSIAWGNGACTFDPKVPAFFSVFKRVFR